MAASRTLALSPASPGRFIVKTGCPGGSHIRQQVKKFLRNLFPGGTNNVNDVSIIQKSIDHVNHMQL